MEPFELQKLLDEINQVLSNTLLRIGLGDSRLARSAKVVLKDFGFSILFNDYVQFVDGGRRPNATPPPIQPIIDFIQRKGIQPTNITELQLAFAISRAIGKRGIEPRPFLERLQIEITELIELHLFEEVNKELTSALNQ